MTILNSAEKSIVKRTVPKTAAQILDATVARLYVSTDGTAWSWTGLMGILVFIDDLIGHTFWFKLMDLKTGNVLWDHELWVDFEYSQDRVFFHSFESNDYQLGFLFEDKSDAQHLFKRVTNRNKYASKNTIANNNAIEIRRKPRDEPVMGFRGQNQNVIDNEQRSRRTKGVLYYDDQPPPEWRSFYAQLEQMGITEDMIAENREFIRDYISKQGGPLVGLEPPIPRRLQHKQHLAVTADETPSRSRSTTVSSMGSRVKKAPPPPPPGASPTPTSVPGTNRTSSSNVTSDVDSPLDSASVSPSPVTESAPALKHRVPPAPVFKGPPPFNSPITTQQQAAPSLPNMTPYPNLPARNPPPVLPQRGAVPPPPPSRNANAPPPPPARRTPSNTGGASATAPPPPPSRRGNAPPPPPSRTVPQLPSRAVPQLPSRDPVAPSAMTSHLPPSMPTRIEQQIPVPPTLLPQTQQSITPPPPPPPALPPQQQNIPIPPPPPPAIAPAAATPMMPAATASIPPPPPMMPAGNSGIPPPPAPPPPAFNNPQTTAALPAPSAGRDQLLSSIRNAGIGSLRKVDKSQLDKPSALLQEARGEPVAPTSNGGASGPGPESSGPPGNLADALAAALSSRKKRVTESDDESDEGW